jgi:RNA polymerase sigma factor (sigma-70 family)
MSDDSVHTEQLHDWVGGIRRGDSAARDELLYATCAQLERLARKMLHRFSNLRSHVQIDELLNNSMLRLLRQLEKVEPASMRDFYNLAAAMMRTELLDLGRHLARIQRHEVALKQGDPDDSACDDPAAPQDESIDLDRWERFHEAWMRLPVEERELVGLLHYHGWTQEQAAELFGISVRTVQRRWGSALVKLHGLMKVE